MGHISATANGKYGRGTTLGPFPTPSSIEFLNGATWVRHAAVSHLLMFLDGLEPLELEPAFIPPYLQACYTPQHDPQHVSQRGILCSHGRWFHSGHPVMCQLLHD